MFAYMMFAMFAMFAIIANVLSFPVVRITLDIKPIALFVKSEKSVAIMILN